MLCASKSVDYSEACFFFLLFFFFQGKTNALTFEGPEAPADLGGQVEDALDTQSNFKWLQRPCEHAWNRVIIPLVLKIWWLAIETQNLLFFMQLIVFLVCVGDLESQTELFWGTQQYSSNTYKDRKSVV